MDTVVSPAYFIRLYAWEVLKRNMGDVWDEENYGDLVPIVPVAEEPDLSEFTGPHIVWGYASDSTGRLFAQNGGSVTFAVYDDDFRRLTKTMNILQAAFERQDETARDINKYSTSKGGAFIGVRFGSVWIGFVEGGTPEDSEGGRQSALININYECFIEYDPSKLVTDVTLPL